MYSSGRSGRHSPDPTRGPLRVPVRKRPGSGARPYGVPLPLPAPPDDAIDRRSSTRAGAVSRRPTPSSAPGRCRCRVYIRR